MARRKLADDKRRHRMNVCLNAQERAVLEEKMKYYGYNNLSEYLRDAGIYERLFVEDLDGKGEIMTKVDELIQLVKKYMKEQQVILIRAELTEADIMIIKKQNKELKQVIDILINQIINKLQTNIKEAISHREFIQTSLLQSDMFIEDYHSKSKEGE